MKKITLFAVAALAASSVYAAVPQAQSTQTRSMREQFSAVSEQMTKKMPVAKVSKSRAEGDVTVSALPTYRNYDAMYLGMNRDFMYKVSVFGFLPAKGEIGFYPYYEADSYNWKWDVYQGQEVVEEVSTDDVLTIPTAPFKQFAGPTLEFTSGQSVVSYNDSCRIYQCGGSPASWSEYFEGFGVTPMKTTAYLLGASETAIDYSDATGSKYNPETGTSVNFDGIISSAYDGATDFKILAYGVRVPGSTAPYALKGGYLFLNAETKAATEIKITVMPIDDEGKINMADTIGSGTMILPAGATSGAVDFVVSKASEVAFLTTDEPVVVPTNGVYMTFSGVNDSENITYFNVVYQNQYYYDYEQASNPNSIIPSLFTANAYLEFEYTDKEGAQKLGRSANYGLYGSKETELKACFEFAIYYDVEYPFIANATQGYDILDMSVEIPAQGAQTNRYFEANTDILQLIDDDYVTVEENNCDWFEYAIQPEEDIPTVFNLIVKADALPEGVEGRVGTLTFTGYGYDETITIFQGDKQASISSIVANKAAQGKVFDLQGRAVKNATKGIFIVDGKKTILK
ncbi:MAG: hypothetical protein K2N10_02750 [Muribaculaceae bacterium]|nr:hypothetical protein [Muribaculaceae bacterium]